MDQFEFFKTTDKKNLTSIAFQVEKERKDELDNMARKLGYRNTQAMIKEYLFDVYEKELKKG